MQTKTTKTVVVEVCQRLHCERYIHGRAWPQYHAGIAGKLEYHGSGMTIEDALLDLAVMFPELFAHGRESMSVVYVGIQAR